MNQKIDKILSELMFELEMQDLDYFKTSTREIIRKRFEMIYDIGREDGLKGVENNINLPAEPEKKVEVSGFGNS